MATRWQRLGIVEFDSHMRPRIECNLKWFKRYEDWCGPSTPESPTLPSAWGRQQDMMTCLDVVQLQHLDYACDFGGASKFLTHCCDIAIDYFHGNWREDTEIDYERCDRKKCRQLAPWFDEFRIGLMASLLSRQSGHIGQLAQFVDLDLSFDEGAWDRTSDDNQAYMVIASYLRERSLESLSGVTGQILASRKIRPKTIIQCLAAIDSNDHIVFHSVFERLVVQYRDREFSRQGRILISLDATILWNLAEMCGLALRSIPVELMDFVITQRSIGVIGVS